MNTFVNFKKRVIILILITFIVRCIAASLIELGNDEVYYFTYALQPDKNHFDHPPMVGFLIQFFTFNLSWVNDFSMRLGAIVCCAIATWLIFLCGKLIKNERTGWIAALLYNASIYTSIISGLFILPDSPQAVFWLASMYLMLAIILQPANKRNNFRWLFLGIFIGLATMSKIHGMFLWLGFGAYILFYQRNFFKNPYLYFSLIITAIIVLPIVLWNVQNDFITFRFHGERVEVKQFAININSFFQTFFGQLFYNNPINILLYILAYIQLKKINMPKNLQRVLWWLAFPIIIATTGISLFRSTLPHWSGPGFTALMLLTAYVMDALTLSKAKLFFTLNKISLIVVAVVLVVGVIFIDFYPGTLSPNKDIKKVGRYDVTLDMYGWKQFGKDFSTVRAEDVQQKTMPADAPLFTENWFPAAHLLFYVARNETEIKSIGSLDRLHKFAWMNEDKKDIPKGSNAYYIATSSFFIDPKELYGNLFSDVKLAHIIETKRSGKVVRYFFIYHLLDAKENITLTRPTNFLKQ